MSKTLEFADTSAQTVKIGDTTTSFTMILGENSNPIDLTNATSIIVKLGNSSGYLKEQTVAISSLSDPLSGQITVSFDSDFMSGLPAGAYLLEVWVTYSSGTAIYPSDTMTGFTITNNIESSTGSTITTITFDDFVQKMKEIASTIKGDKGDTGTVDNAGLTTAPAFQALKTQVDNSAVGNNLLTGTSGTLQICSFNSWASANLSSTNISLISGQTYTARMWIQGYDVPTQLAMRAYSASGSQIDYVTGNIIGANSSGYSTVTWTADSNWTNTVKFTLSFTSQQSATHSGQYSESKLEKGSIATDWCPNPLEIRVGPNPRSLIVNDSADTLNHMSVVVNLPQFGDKTDDAPQFMQVDNKTGRIYWGWQDNNAGSQRIVELDKTGKVLRDRDLKITNVVWLEGCSLYHDATTGHVCFIVPTDLNGNWFLYDYDTDTKSEEFHMQGSAKYCIDDSGQYFVTEQERYDSTNSINVQTIGFNIYSLSSVLAKKPVLTTFVPVKDSYVRGDNKIQGVQMIGGNLYIGRGHPGQLRTTVINQAGAVLSDYNWNQDDIYSLLGLKNGRSVESEGISIIKLNQLTLPALSIISIDDNGYHYGIIAAGDPNGTVIRSTAGLSAAAITRFGAGENELDFVTAKSDPSILAQLLTVRQRKSYTFTVEAGNAGLASQMASSTGVATVRSMDTNCNVLQMTVIATDYNNSTWTICFDNGVWSHWSNVVYSTDTANWQKNKITNDDGSNKYSFTKANTTDLAATIQALPLGYHTFYCQSGVQGNPSLQSVRGIVEITTAGSFPLGVGYLIDSTGAFWSFYVDRNGLNFNLSADDSKVLHLSTGGTTSRPTGIGEGYQYFDTSLKKPIWYTGNNWVDATGTTV